MKIAATTVGTKGPETPAQNQQRLEAARQALMAAKELDADVLVLPGGYFKTYDHRSRDDIAKSLMNEAMKLGLAVVFGIDVDSTEPSNSGTKGKKQQSSTQWSLFPMYVYAWSPTDNKELCWQQRSIFAIKRQEPLINAYDEFRPVKIGAETLAVLSCGEIFNEHIRDALRNHKPKPKVVADSGHKGRGFRVHDGMEPLAEGEQGIASMCSLHVQGHNAKKRYCIPGKGYDSTDCTDKTVNGPPRIEIKLLEF